MRLLRADLLAEQDDLAGAPLPHHHRQPLRGSAGGHRAVLETDVADVGVVDHHREVAGHLELVAAADADAVDARERRLADPAQPVVSVLEGAEPLPVALRVPEILRRPLLEVGADAEGAPGAR